MGEKREGQREWRVHVESTLDSGIVDLRAQGGGDFARSFKATLSDGREVFIKTHDNPPPHFFSTEAAGLQWLREAQAAPVPEVLLFSDTPPCLVLEWIESSRGSTADQEAVFGRQMSQLHASTPMSFGRQDRRTTGSLAVPNTPCADWVEFYRDNRLLPLAKLASDRHVLSGPSMRRLERVAGELDQFGASDEPPARLHGDLWAGNRLVDRRGVSWLIDPAAHGGHREFDLAMMRLFGGFGHAVFDAYQEASPLSEGWQTRIALHQLAPLVVHAIKFGGSYCRAVDDALDSLI